MAKTTKTVTLSVKNVPADLAKRLKERAAGNHRSLQGELLAILHKAANDQPFSNLDNLIELANRLGLPPEGNESTRIIRQDRDERSR